MTASRATRAKEEEQVAEEEAIEGGEAIAVEREVVLVQAGTAPLKVEETHTADMEAREAATETSMGEAINSNTSLLNLALLSHLSRT